MYTCCVSLDNNLASSSDDYVKTYTAINIDNQPTMYVCQQRLWWSGYTTCDRCRVEDHVNRMMWLDCSQTTNQKLVRQRFKLVRRFTCSTPSTSDRECYTPSFLARNRCPNHWISMCWNSTQSLPKQVEECLIIIAQHALFEKHSSTVFTANTQIPDRPCWKARGCVGIKIKSTINNVWMTCLASQQYVVLPEIASTFP